MQGKHIIDPVCAGLHRFMGTDLSRCTWCLCSPHYLQFISRSWRTAGLTHPATTLCFRVLSASESVSAPNFVCRQKTVIHLQHNHHVQIGRSAFWVMTHMALINYEKLWNIWINTVATNYWCYVRKFTRCICWSSMAHWQDSLYENEPVIEG